MSSMVGRGGVGWALGLASAMMAGLAGAQGAEEAREGEIEAQTRPEREAERTRPRSREAVQLSLQGSLVDYQKQTLTPDKDPESTVQPENQKSSSTSFGLLGSGFGIGVGYAWDRLLLGARAQLTTTTASREGGVEAKLSSFGLLPRVEYMFDEGSARPFIAGLLAVDHTLSSSKTLSGNGTSSEFENSSTRFGMGAAFGIHAFLNQAVSLDPEFSVLYGEGSGTATSSGQGSTSVSQDYSTSVVRVLLTLGLSGWIDTAGAPPTPPPRSEAPDMARAALAPDTARAAIAPVPAAIDEQEPKPLSTDIRLPNYRRLYLQVFKDAAQPAVLVRLTEPRDSFALRACDKVAVWENGTPIKFAIRTHGEHYLTARLPITALEVLVTNPESTIAVCADRWRLGQESREAVHSFLNARRELLDLNEEGAAPEAAPPAPAPIPASEAPVTPPASSGTPPASSGAPPASSGAPPASSGAPQSPPSAASAPTRAFPTAPEATPNTPRTTSPKGVAPKN
jgi:hypothetical protein